MTKEQLNAELAAGIESLKDSKVYSVDEVDREMEKEFGL